MILPLRLLLMPEIVFVSPDFVAPNDDDDEMDSSAPESARERPSVFQWTAFDARNRDLAAQIRR